MNSEVRLFGTKEFHVKRLIPEEFYRSKDQNLDIREYVEDNMKHALIEAILDEIEYEKHYQLLVEQKTYFSGEGEVLHLIAYLDSIVNT